MEDSMKPRYEPKEFLTVREAAKIIGRAPGSIYSRIEHGTLDAVTVDGRLMLRAIDVFDAANDDMLEHLNELHAAGLLPEDTSPPVPGWRR
jgi:hypothetical protein